MGTPTPAVPPEPFNKNDLLLKEYDASVALTNNVDTVRNALTGFFLIFAGIAATAVGLFLRDTTNVSPSANPRVYTGFLLLLVGVIGLLFVTVIARLRRVQLERYGIILKIRDHLLGTDTVERRLIPQSRATLPRQHGDSVAPANPQDRQSPNRATGSYLFLCTLLLADSPIFGYGVVLLLVPQRLTAFGWILGTVLAIVFWVSQDRLYFRLSNYKAPA